MPRYTERGSKKVLELYSSEVKALDKARSLLDFIYRNSDDPTASGAALQAIELIGAAQRACVVKLRLKSEVPAGGAGEPAPETVVETNTGTEPASDPDADDDLEPVDPDDETVVYEPSVHVSPAEPKSKRRRTLLVGE